MVIVGGGNSAGQAALNFARQATKVTMLVRGESLKNTLSTYLLERIEDTPAIAVLTRTTLTTLEGEDALESITYRSKNPAAQPPSRLVMSSFVSEGVRAPTGQSQGYCIATQLVTFSRARISTAHTCLRRCGKIAGTHSSWRPAFQAYLQPVMSVTTPQRGARQRREMVQPQFLWRINF